MATNELPIRFTENKYATKSEVSKELKMGLIDTIWSNILAYRSNFNKYLQIRSVDKSQFLICFCTTVTTALANSGNRLQKVVERIDAFDDNSSDFPYFRTQSYLVCLKKIAEYLHLDVTDNYLISVINGEYKDLSSSHIVLERYLNCLRFINDSRTRPIDEDFLADLYSKITGNDELTSFYRTQEDSNPLNRVLIDRVYNSAPVSLIEGMMNDLFVLIADSSMNIITRALITYFYFDYVKPLPTYSSELAVLMAKAVLARSDFAFAAPYLCLESFLAEGALDYARIANEVQKTNDVTYFLNFALKIFDRKTDELLDSIINRNFEKIKEEMYQEEQAIVAPVVEQEPVEEPVQEEPLITQPVVEPAPRVIEKPIAQPKEEPQVAVQEQIAYGYIPPVLDEKQAHRLEQHLLELDPSMKKGEAKFYARHCTIGKKYTIQQYKKAIGCAYETARTSMEHLVELGYYRKEMVKNKFVYTPIPRAN